jgi:hypothetical protein
MGELVSKLFTEGDPATVKKLEDCATGRPNEMSSHFTIGQSGEHIRKVQQALKNVQDLEPELGIPQFEVNGVYDDAFARAIEIYKEKKDIRNYAKKIDNIVGIKTIRSLDRDAQKRKREDPAPRPKKGPGDHRRALPNCVLEADCPPSQSFSVRMLFFALAGEILEASKYWFTIRDRTNQLSALYLMTAGGLGTPSPIPGATSYGGEAKEFDTSYPVRVTRFKWCQIGGATPSSPASKVVSLGLITMQYVSDDSGTHTAGPMTIDTGKVSMPGAGAQTGPWSLLTACQGGPGATRRVLTGDDLVF